MTKEEEIRILKAFKISVLKRQYSKQIDLEVKEKFTPVIQGKPKVLTLYKKAS